MIRESVDPINIRDYNLSQVLMLIHRKRFISRAAIVKETNLSATSISSIASELLSSKFIYEAGEGKSSGGRRPILLQFNPNVRFTIGVDLGAAHINTVLTNLYGEIKDQRSIKFNTADNPLEALKFIKQQIAELLQSEGLETDNILGIGVSVPAPLDGENLDRLSPVILPKWKDIEIKEEFSKLFNLPVYIDNDANCGAIAEHWWGSGRGISNMVYIKLGTGIGSGLIINSKIYRGTGGTAGEIGHTTINPDGPLCRCGNNGCLESFVGVPPIVNSTLEKLEQYPHSSLNNHQVDIEKITTAAIQKDALAEEIVKTAGEYLGISIANLLNLVNPEFIILGGDLIEAGDIFMDAVRSTAFTRSISKAANEVTIISSDLKQDVISIGAATLVIYYAFLPINIRCTLNLL